MRPEKILRWTGSQTKAVLKAYAEDIRRGLSDPLTAQIEEFKETLSQALADQIESTGRQHCEDLDCRMLEVSMAQSDEEPIFRPSAAFTRRSHSYDSFIVIKRNWQNSSSNICSSSSIRHSTAATSAAARTRISIALSSCLTGSSRDFVAIVVHTYQSIASSTSTDSTSTTTRMMRLVLLGACQCTINQQTHKHTNTHHTRNRPLTTKHSHRNQE